MADFLFERFVALKAGDIIVTGKPAGDLLEADENRGRIEGVGTVRTVIG